MRIYQEGLYYIFCFKSFDALRITAKLLHVCKCNTADFLLGAAMQKCSGNDYTIYDKL